jgi:hypothetical protein
MPRPGARSAIFCWRQGPDLHILINYSGDVGSVEFIQHTQNFHFRIVPVVRDELPHTGHGFLSELDETEKVHCRTQGCASMRRAFDLQPSPMPLTREPKRLMGSSTKAIAEMCQFIEYTFFLQRLHKH